MSDYIMRLPTEPDRIRSKTSPVLLDHHLTWAGVTSNESFVDFGCASGEVVRAVMQLSQGGRVVGLDADPSMLSFAKAEDDRIGLPGIEYANVSFGGIGSTGLSDGAFDHAWTRFVLEYLPNPIEVVREMTRVVKPGGKVTLIDLQGNCVWHHPLPSPLSGRLDEVMADLSATGFDPYIGSRLQRYAADVGLVDIREQVEPYHWIVGRPDAAAAEAWTAKLHGIRQNYIDVLAPEKVRLHGVFDELLDFILSDNTMTWSLAYLVQGTVRTPDEA